MELQKHFLISFASLLVLMVLALFLYMEEIKYEDRIAQASVKRYQSYMLADELRQTSDDLTRMARTYTVTGDPRFKEYFDRILAIRNGAAPRPMDYQKIYWDFVVASGSSPRMDVPPKSLRELMREAEFTETEFALLEETENESNELVNLENRAMNAMEGIFEDAAGGYNKAEPDRELARNLLHGDDYHQAKEKIMTPLAKFFDTVDHRTAGEVELYSDKQQRVDLIFILVLGLSTVLALVSLGLGGWSLLQRKTADSGKSRLAQQLASRGYTASESDDKGSARAMLVRRLAGKAGGDAHTGDSKADETSSLQFFLKTFWHNWPIIVAATIVTFLILGVSWWFLSENRIQSYAKLRDELKFSLDSTHSAVQDWLHQTSREADEFADAVGKDMAQASSLWLNNRADPASAVVREETMSAGGRATDVLPGQELELLFAQDTSIVSQETLNSYLIVGHDGVVLSSNRRELTGKYFPLPEGTMERLQTQKKVILFPNPEAASDLLSQNIVFGSLVGENQGAVFIMASPHRTLAKILRRGYSGNYGEVYLVDAKGHFISEPRWKEAIMEHGRGGPDTRTIVGLYAYQEGKIARAESLPLSVRRVIAGDSGGELQEYDNYLGEKVVGYWSWNNMYGFGIINEFKSEEALATSRAFTWQTLAGSGLTAGLILTLTLFSIWSRTRVAKTNEQLRLAFKTIKSHNDKLAQDLRIGQKVQMDMLPDPLNGSGFNMEAFLKPAQSVSGDFYDFSLTQNGKVYFCVGDVSGKGIPASLFMSVTKALLNKVLDQTDQTREIVTRVNDELSVNNESNMFVTMIVGMMNLHTGELLITNAGHNLPYIKKHSGELLCLEDVQGPLVGTFEDVKFKQQSITLDPGDIVLLYSDGVTEAQNIRDEFYEDKRLKELLDKNRFGAAKEMTSAVFRSVLRFMGRAEQFDDITILSFQYTGN